MVMFRVLAAVILSERAAAESDGVKMFDRFMDNLGKNSST